MLVKLIALACFASLSGGMVAFAQTDGPAELPSVDYQGQSYVDSKGCIFLKAGYGGEASWVPRVSQDRKPICGQTPTNAVAKVSDAAATAVPAAPKTRIKKTKTPRCCCACTGDDWLPDIRSCGTAICHHGWRVGGDLHRNKWQFDGGQITSLPVRVGRRGGAVRQTVFWRDDSPDPRAHGRGCHPVPTAGIRTGLEG